MDRVKRSLISLHFTVILLGVTALFSKIIPLSALDITFGRAFFACLVLALLVKLSGGKLRLNCGRDYLIAFGLGLLMAAHWVTYFAAMQYSSVSVGMIALFTFPVITVLLEPFFERATLAWQDLLSTLIVLAGIYLITPIADLNNDVFLGVLTGVFSALLYSLRNLFHRRLFSHYGGAHSMMYQCLIIIIVLVPFVSNEFYQASDQTYFLLILLGIFFTALPHAMIAASLKYLRAKTFSLVACMQPFYGVLFAVLLLSEKPTWQTLLGGVLIISAAVYETINTGRSREKSSC
jgi:drug/metabolite transporter (DMT)-like permease